MKIFYNIVMTIVLGLFVAGCGFFGNKDKAKEADAADATEQTEGDAEAATPAASDEETKDAAAASEWSKLNWFFQEKVLVPANAFFYL